MSNSPHIRRLASSDEDEACKDFSWLIGTDDEVDDLFSWSPSEFFHGGSLAEQTSSTQTGHRNNQGEGVMQSTVPLPRRTQDVAQGFQVSSDFALSSSWEPSSAQQYAVRTQNFQSAGGLLSYEPTMSSVAQEFETRLYGAEHMQGLHLLEDASAEDMGFPDGHLGLVSASSTEGNLEQSDYTRQVFNEERELLQDSGFLGGSSSRKRGHGTDDTAEYVGHLKKPLNNKETKNLAEGLQGHSDPLLGSAETYPAQPQGIYPQESLFSWDSQSPEEAHTLSATEESGTMSHDHGPMAGLDSLDEKLEKEPFLEQWFFDYILDPSLNSPKSSVELSENAHQLVSELMANAADEGTSSSSPAPEGQSFAADGSSSGDSQLPASEVQDLPGPQEPAAGSPELDSTAGQEGRPSSTAQHNPEFKDIELIPVELAFMHGLATGPFISLFSGSSQHLLQASHFQRSIAPFNESGAGT
ncbi:hypothetical protein EBH_0065660 [Eimeria brunetti]|uniref:Uncharacterized protein n=1 Tax=Eimeria brunetti TaxID=51314 RepID=U6LXN8_9EIME|nr:hypothetical protein EBH_0065660 [Eimeria brunetti]